MRSWRAKLLTGGSREPSVVKAYQILRAILNTAVDDELIQRTRAGSRVRTATTCRSARCCPSPRCSPQSRPSLPGTALVLLAAFTTLRFGELAALRRRDVDLEALTVYVKRTQAELHTGKLFDKAPETAASVRPIAFPVEHLDTFTKKPEDAQLFEGLLRRSNFRDTWAEARKDSGISADVHFHDLRHTRNTLASSAGASTRELMTRMGHSNTRAAHLPARVLARRSGGGIWHVSGSALISTLNAAGNDQGPVHGDIPAELGLRHALRSLAMGGHSWVRTSDICFVRAALYH